MKQIKKCRTTRMKGKKWEWYDTEFLDRFESGREAIEYLNQNAYSIKPGSFPVGRLICVQTGKDDVKHMYEDHEGNCTYRSERMERFDREFQKEIEEMKRRERWSRIEETEEERREREFAEEWERYITR